jgi:hypothetical protein
VWVSSSTKSWGELCQIYGQFFGVKSTPRISHGISAVEKRYNPQLASHNLEYIDAV